MTERLLRIFDRLLVAFGERGWWPAESALEVMVGAILTQNTAWKNVEKALRNLKGEGLLSVESLYLVPITDLAAVIRPSGFYNVKALRLKAFIEVLQEEFGGSIMKMGSVESQLLRKRLLDIKGIGPETADSILLYALGKPVFVVDAYTKRFVRNHAIHDHNDDYEALRDLFMTNLPSDRYLYNEFHALIVCLGQNFCKKKPICHGCPLEREGEGKATQASRRSATA